MYTGTGLTSGFSTLNYAVNVKNGQVNGVNGYMSGVTFGSSYAGQGYSQNSNSDQVEITTAVVVSQGIFFQGIGTIYQETVNYRITIPCGEHGSNGSGGSFLIWPLPTAD